MAKTKISEFSTTPGNNTDIDGINIAEGCAPSGINDAIRELMAQLKDFQAGTAGDSFNGPVGTTTAAAGAFTTLSASSTVSGTGFSTYLASPPAIGGTTAAAGSFTNLSASGTVSGTGFSNYLASPPAIGGTTAAAGSFTTLSASGNVTLSGGTANGVAYLNGSKVLTTGSALTFDGTRLLTIGNGVFAQSTLNASVVLQLEATNGSSVRTTQTQLATGGLVWNNDVGGNGASPNYAWQIVGSEGMRLTSTGLGIGTSSPATKLEVYNATNADQYWRTSAVSLYAQANNSNGSGLFGTLSNHPLVFWTNSSEKMRLDTSGNLGLGVTPSAWGSAYKALQVSSGGSYAASSNAAFWYSNAYNDNTNWRYVTSTSASGYTQFGGAHSWFTAPSGTAGNAISFTQAMTLDASGNLLVGTTTAGAGAGSGRFTVESNSAAVSVPVAFSDLRTDNFSSSMVYIVRKGTIVGTISTTNVATAYNTSSDYRLKNITGPITNSGAYIDSLNPVEGTWKSDGSVFVGLLAHEAQEVSRTSVATGVKDGAEMQSMDYSSSEIIANMIAELKSLRARVAALESN